MESAIKETAKRSRHLIVNSVTLENPNGHCIIHDLLRYHHPRVLDSLAPAFDEIYRKSPKMIKPERGSTYDLAVDDFKARCNEWELSISMYPEVKTLRRSQHALKQLQGILPVLKAYVLPIENHITRHYQQHRFELVEPEISIEYSIEEAMTILKAAAHTLDQQTGLSFHGPPSVPQIMINLPTRELPPDAIDPLDDFADYCVNNLDYDSSEPMVSYIKKFQNRRGETSQAEPCKHAACSRTHPTNGYCICHGSHFVNWHVIGLPEGIKAIKDNFVKQHTAKDDPWKQGNDRN
jgi:hypothetical protein